MLTSELQCSLELSRRHLVGVVWPVYFQKPWVSMDFIVEAMKLTDLLGNSSRPRSGESDYTFVGDMDDVTVMDAVIRLAGVIGRTTRREAMHGNRTGVVSLDITGTDHVFHEIVVIVLSFRDIRIFSSVFDVLLNLLVTLPG